MHDPTTVGGRAATRGGPVGSIARYEQLARDAGIDGKTVKSHLEFLERLFQVRIRRAWHVSLGKRRFGLRSSPRAILAFSRAWSVGGDADRVRRDDGFAGALFETFVATELEQQASWSAQPLTYRDGDRAVDVIVERPAGEIVGVEVKAGATVCARDFRAWNTCLTSSDRGCMRASCMPASARCPSVSVCGRCGYRASDAPPPLNRASERARR